jgi:hypothetical protein
MTRATAYFLTQLREYLEANTSSKRRELQKLHERLADGKKLHKVSISRHTNLKVTPNLDTGIVYLHFAQLNGIIESAPPSVGLFRYVNKDAPRTGGKTKGGKWQRSR